MQAFTFLIACLFAQCATHKNLGWRIQVLDPEATTPTPVSPTTPSGSSSPTTPSVSGSPDTPSVSSPSNPPTFNSPSTSKPNTGTAALAVIIGAAVGGVIALILVILLVVLIVVLIVVLTKAAQKPGEVKYLANIPAASQDLDATVIKSYDDDSGAPPKYIEALQGVTEQSV